MKNCSVILLHLFTPFGIILIYSLFPFTETGKRGVSMEENKIQRLVGIDFGTSTSLIRVKRYQGEQPVGDSYNVGAVTYGNGAGDSKAVTLVRHNADNTFTCGRYGEEKVEGSTIYREFKMDLENSDVRKQNLAKELTGEFFKYLYERYTHQQSDLGQISDDVRTIISYPAKWKPETRSFMEAVAAQVGFANVSSMDEPSAALYAVLCRKMDEITQQGLLTAGQSGYVLLVDMGAGTTDLAVCRYQLSDAAGELSAADRIKTEIVSTWPDHSSNLTFGGREVDRLLEDYLAHYLRDCGFNEQIANQVIRGVPGVKAWKEDTVSTLLAKNQSVNTCSVVTQFIQFAPQPKPFPAFGREKFQQMLGEKLEDFKQLVFGCLANAADAEPELFGKGVDMVVLTGGHSSWYFTSELLDGTMPGIEHPILEKVQREKNRVLRLSNPQETVALGMVYSQLPFHVVTPKPEPEPEPKPEPEPEPEPEPGGYIGEETMEEFIRGYRFKSIQPVSEGMLPTLKQNLNVPMQATVYQGYDTTFFGSCKNGSIFTDQGIYYRGTFSDPIFCDWCTFAEGFLRFSGCVVYLHNKKTHKEITISAFYSSDEEIRLFYKLLQNHARRMLNVLPPKQPADDLLDFSRVTFGPVIRNVIAGYNPSALRSLTKKSIPHSMRMYLQIPSEEILYLAHDDTLFKTGKSGTILTHKGIHVRDTLDTSTLFTTWITFAKGTLVSEGYRIYVDLPNERRLVGVFAYVTSEALGLYMELQKAFRAAATADDEPEQDVKPLSKEAVLVENFLKKYDLTGLEEVLSPAYIPDILTEAEPYAGRLLLAHKDCDTGDGGKTWFWFAVGTEGICNNKKQFISWADFLTADIALTMGAKIRYTPEDLLSSRAEAWQYSQCTIGQVSFAAMSSVNTAAMVIFFSELQKYMRNPEEYQITDYGWTNDDIRYLQTFAAENPFAGVYCRSVGDPQFKTLLALPESAVPLYEYSSKAILGGYKVCCIDDKGFRHRLVPQTPVFIPFRVFLNHPLWVIHKGQWWYFYAGTHLLMHTGNEDAGRIGETLSFLCRLQQYLREELSKKETV